MQSINQRPFIAIVLLLALMFGATSPTIQAAPVKVGNIVTFASGVYYYDSISIPTGEVWQGVVSGAANNRTIITRADGYPPTVSIADGGSMLNIWVGGKRGGSAWIHPRHNVVLSGNTFFGYNEAVGVADAKNVHITNNRFVNTGTGLLYHPLYINNHNALAGEGTTVLNNLFVGGEGYPIHLYHSPSHNLIQGNFVGGGFRCIAATGHYNIFADNICWSNTAFANIYIDPDNEDYGSSNLSFTHNLVGWNTTTDWYYPPADSFIDDNWFVIPAPQIFGTHPVSKSKNQIKPFIGNYTPAQIDAAIASLKTKFATLTPAQLLADATLKPNFNLLRNAVVAWAQ